MTNQKRRCLVLGGSGVLGQAVCRVLLKNGAQLGLTYFKNEEGEKALQANYPEDDIKLYKLDAGDADQIQSTVTQAVADLGGLDALVHCIGVGVTHSARDPNQHIRMDEITAQGWDEMFRINVRSVFLAATAALPALKESANAQIVLTGSIDGEKAVPSPIHYASTKAALGGLVRSMTKELGEFQIKVNMVTPGIMDAGLSQTLPGSMREEYKKHCGFKREARPGEIASFTAWLALENTYVTGRSIIIDGAL
ncbi:MAG: SDR family NAD(P)-dependent oxidoreductase [Planctomycetota bacterium]|nr:SDR family NAD(P)-dependent oxidoreductase [Planctomycetota bacterium]